jgi:hypothetical protein
MQEALQIGYTQVQALEQPIGLLEAGIFASLSKFRGCRQR